MFNLCAYHGSTSFCPPFNSVKAEPYPPHVTDEEAQPERESSREEGAGPEVQPRALVSDHQALPPRGTCRSKFRLHSLLPRACSPLPVPSAATSHTAFPVGFGKPALSHDQVTHPCPAQAVPSGRKHSSPHSPSSAQHTDVHPSGPSPRGSSSVSLPRLTI